MNKSCSKIQNQIPEYLQGLLMDKEKDMFLSHIENCKACEQYLSFFSSVIDKENELEFEPSIDLENKIKTRVKKEAPKAKQKKLSYTLRWSVAAAIICIVFVKLGQEAGLKVIEKPNDQKLVFEVFTSSLDDNGTVFTRPYTKYSSYKLKSK
jgi:hypothetical protein